MSTLQDIETHVHRQMEAFAAARIRLTADSIPFVQDINAHLIRHAGKQLRPMLTFLTAQCCGMDSMHPNADNIVKIAVAMETLHNSTLIHDDVVDESDMRRGVRTLNSRWGNKIAVLVGDYYLSRVMSLLNQVNIQSVTAAAENAISQMSQGELIQLQNIGNNNCPEETYLQIISKKTAVFLSECCHIGALMATADTSMHEAARKYGEYIGIAFQIRDDIIDYLPSSITGKPQGNDLNEHKFTLPLILTLKHCNTATQEKLLSILANSHLTTNDIETVGGIVTENNGIELASSQMKQFLSKAAEHALLLPDNKYRTAMISLTDFLKEY